MRKYVTIAGLCIVAIIIFEWPYVTFLLRIVPGFWAAASEGLTPIAFYGKVVDENGAPVSNAQIDFSCNDLSASGTSNYHRRSDRNGLFSISRIRGKLLVVQVAKDGYYTSRADNGGFYYAGQDVNFVPNKGKPELFHLRRIGVADPLIHIQSPLGRGKSFKTDIDGLPVELSLTSGEVVASGKGDLRVECWTKHNTSTWKFDWRCRITVVHGGLQGYTEEFPFQAPLTGYDAFDEVDMPLSLGEKWGDRAKKSYFLHLANGNYGRMNFEINPGGDHFFQLDSYVNPSGSRNLEFDPNKIVQISN